jgi:hypothetical protein
LKNKSGKDFWCLTPTIIIHKITTLKGILNIKFLKNKKMDGVFGGSPTQNPKPLNHKYHNKKGSYVFA